MRALLCCVGLVLVACGPSAKSPSPPRETRVEWIQAEHLTTEDRQLVLDAYAHHRASWESDHGPAPKVKVLQFWGTDRLPSGYRGFAWWESGRVELVVGRQLEVPWVYHELCHMAYHDPGHDNPRWDAWDMAQKESVTSLLNQREGAEQ